MRSLIDMAADRGAFIDQSQSLNLFMESPTIGKLVSMYLLRLEAGPEDHVLPAVAAGDAHQQDDRGAASVTTPPAAASPVGEMPGPSPTPTRRRWPARSRTPSRAKPASERASLRASEPSSPASSLVHRYRCKTSRRSEVHQG